MYVLLHSFNSSTINKLLYACISSIFSNSLYMHIITLIFDLYYSYVSILYYLIICWKSFLINKNIILLLWKFINFHYVSFYYRGVIR